MIVCCSTISNEKLLMTIHDVKQNLVLFCYAGKTLVTKKVNILSFIIVQKKYRVKYHSTLGQGFIIHKADSTTWPT